MKTRTRSRKGATTTINHLRTGTTYRVVAADRTSVGVYLGIESPHGDHAVLLRQGNTTLSIPLDDIEVVELAA